MPEEQVEIVEKETVQYGSTLLKFSLAYADRKTLGIKVHPNRNIEVIAPLDAEIAQVKKKVKSKAPWILKQQEFFLSFEPRITPRKYISGETHYYLGRQYRLKLHKAAKESVKLQGGLIHIQTKDPKDIKKVESLLKQWYQSKADIHFPQLFEESLTLTKRFYPHNPTLKYTWMKKRWGSCSNKGLIRLNMELIKAPKHCISYVIVHELCHLVHLNHSTAFFKLLETHFPDWKATKKKLEELMA